MYFTKATIVDQKKKKTEARIFIQIIHDILIIKSSFG